MEGSVESIQFDCGGLGFSADTPPQRGLGGVALSRFKPFRFQGSCRQGGVSSSVPRILTGHRMETARLWRP